MTTIDISDAQSGVTPFSSAWVRIEPGGLSHKHRHHDREVWFIMKGEGQLTVEVAGQRTSASVSAGQVVEFDPFSTHEVANDADEPLVFLTVYWDDLAQAVSKATAYTDTRLPARAVVMAAPPTTNGDLHLGHLSGPYLGADIAARYLHLRGVDAVFCCGSDDFQSYVEFAGRAGGEGPAEISSRYSQAVYETLVAASAQPNVYIRSGHDHDHQQRVQDTLLRLVRSGHAVDRVSTGTFCSQTGRYAYEPYLSGACPHCGTIGRGNSCEECGLPHDSVDLRDATITETGAAPVLRPVRRIVFPLEPFRKDIQAFILCPGVPDRLRMIGERMLATTLPEVALTHPTDFGVEVGLAGFEQQRIWAWFDMWVNYWSQQIAIGQRRDWPPQEAPSGQGTDLELIHFFGCDNGWHHVVLYPALFKAVWNRLPELRMVTNEFLLLDGRKFSTSQRHAIWGRQALSEFPVDVVRLYLASIRPETAKTNFERAGLRRYVDVELRSHWQEWIGGVGRRVMSEFGCRAPVAGLWSEDQTAFLTEIDAFMIQVARHLATGTFSPASVSLALSTLVRCAQRFANGNAKWESVTGAQDTRRAGMAVELAAIRAFAIAVSPIAPDFGRSLWSDLGLGVELPKGVWNDGVQFVPSGCTVSLRADYFAA